MRIRAHHLFCMRGFQGKGYSPLFVQHMAAVITRLARGEHCTVVAVADDICAVCPHRTNDACTLYGDTVERMDAIILDALRLRQRAYAIGELYDAVDHAFTSWESIEAVCGGCQWRGDCTFYQAYEKKKERDR